MADYGGNYAYGMSPTYKDGDDSGTILVEELNLSTGVLTPTVFPILSTVPSSYRFGYTNLTFVPKKHLWDFGDGNSSTEKNPEHTYTTHGYHDVQLSVMNNSGVWSRIARIYKHYIALGKLDFEGNPLSGDKPLAVTFEDSSLSPTGSQYTGMQWDYGDTYGATGSTPEPHTYLDYGSYTVGINVTLGDI